MMQQPRQQPKRPRQQPPKPPGLANSQAYFTLLFGECRRNHPDVIQAITQFFAQERPEQYAKPVVPRIFESILPTPRFYIIEGPSITVDLTPMKEQLCAQKHCILLGRFMFSARQPFQPGNCRLSVNLTTKTSKVTCPEHRFGEKTTTWFPLGLADQLAEPFTIEIVAKCQLPILSWFVVEFVHPRNPADIVRLLEPRFKTRPDSKPPYRVKSSRCKKTCPDMDPHEIISQLQSHCVAKCSACNESIMLDDLVASSAVQVVEESEDMKIAKTRIYEMICMTSCMTKLEPDWSSVVFASSSDTTGELEPPPDYQSTEEYIDMIEKWYDM